METGIHELTAGYALDALDDEERDAYEAHLEGCASCQEELASFTSVTEGLAVAASGPAPTLALRDRIVAAARAEPQVVVPFEPRRPRAVPFLGAVAAVAAVAALAAGLWATQLSSDLDEARSALDRQRELAAVVADPGSRTVALQKGKGRLVVRPDGRAVLVLEGLDPAPAGKTYEIWVVEGDAPARAGLFEGGGQAELVGVEGIVDAGDVVAVTIEVDGGVDAPRTKPIVASEPV